MAKVIDLLLGTFVVGMVVCLIIAVGWAISPKTADAQPNTVPHVRFYGESEDKAVAVYRVEGGKEFFYVVRDQKTGAIVTHQ